MCDKATDRAFEPYCSIGWLYFGHVSCVPAHFRFSGQTKDKLGLLGSSDKVGDICIHRVEAVVHVHGIVIEG